MACGILVPWLGIKPVPTAVEMQVLTTGSPGKTLGRIFKGKNRKSLPTDNLVPMEALRLQMLLLFKVLSLALFHPYGGAYPLQTFFFFNYSHFQIWLHQPWQHVSPLTQEIQASSKVCDGVESDWQA